MRFSVPRLGMIWGNIGHQRGKVEYTLSAYEQNPYAGVFGEVTHRYYSRLFKTILTIWVPNVLLGYSIYTWANWEHDRCARKLPNQFANEKPLDENTSEKLAKPDDLAGRKKVLHWKIRCLTNNPDFMKRQDEGK